MIFTSLQLEGSYLINLDKKEDSRGFFSRFYCKEEFKNHGLDSTLVEINTSQTIQKGTVRGMHFQYPPKAQTRVVRCLRGAIWDVIVDLRQDSLSYGQWFGSELNAENRSMMYVPKGFAHGFQTLSNEVEMLYLHSEFFSPTHEGSLIYDDPIVGIHWPLPISEISNRDATNPFLNELKTITL